MNLAGVLSKEKEIKMNNNPQEGVGSSVMNHFRKEGAGVVHYVWKN